MNMNDLRAMAYGKNNGSVKNQDEKKVQPFVPKTFIKTSETASQDVVKNTSQANANIKPFIPVKLDNDFSKVSESKTNSIIKQAASSFNSKDNNSKTVNQSQMLDKATDYLKNGGLLKVAVEKSNSDGTDSVYRRVAKFLLLIGEDKAAKILPHLTEKQIEKIIPEIASIRTVNKDEASVILAEFNELLTQTKSSGGIETAREMLEKAYGKDKADQMLQSVIQFDGEKPFSYLTDYDEERLYQLIKDENVGVQSMVLSYLPPEKAAKIINQMTPEEKHAVVIRLAKMEPVNPEVIRRVSQAMQEKAQHQVTEKSENIDGRNALAQILKKMDFGTEIDILNDLAQEDPDLGVDLRNRLFTYEDVINADDRFIQSELRMLSESEIAYLIAAKSDEFREKILSNISAGRRSEVRAQEDILKPIRKADVDSITTAFVSKLRNAFEAGHLVIKDRNDDTFI